MARKLRHSQSSSSVLAMQARKILPTCMLVSLLIGSIIVFVWALDLNEDVGRRDSSWHGNINSDVAKQRADLYSADDVVVVPTKADSASTSASGSEGSEDEDDPTAAAPSAKVPSTEATSVIATSVIATDVIAPSAVAPSEIAPSEIAPSVIATTEIAPSEIVPSEIATSAIATSAIATSAIATSAIATSAIATSAVVATNKNEPNVQVQVQPTEAQLRLFSEITLPIPLSETLKSQEHAIELFAEQSTGLVYYPDKHRNRLCTFQNVCVQGASILFPIADEAERKKLSTMFYECQNKVGPEGKRSKMCLCFMSNTRVAFVNPYQLAKLPYYPGHTWFLDTFVSGQFGHFVETMGIFHGVQINREYYGLPVTDRIYLPKQEGRLTSITRFYYELVAKTLPQSTAPPLMPGLYCFERMSSSAVTAVMATSPEDAAAFRERALAQVQIPINKCPPAQTVMLLRAPPSTLRKPTNLASLLSVLKELGIVDLHVTMSSERNSTEAQLKLFSHTGFMVASHSSQLVNMVMMQPNSALIEVMPALHNFDFGQNADLFGLHYHAVIGGSPPRQPIPPLVEKCHQEYRACDGKPFSCIQQLVWGNEKRCSNDRDYKEYSKSVKQKNFAVDIDAFRISAKAAIEELNVACGGHWPGVKQTPVISA